MMMVKICDHEFPMRTHVGIPATEYGHCPKRQWHPPSSSETSWVAPMAMELET